MKYRIVERLGEFRVQRRKSFLGIKFWVDAVHYSVVSSAFHTPTFYSLHEAKKEMKKLIEIDERLRTPWRVVK